MKTRLRRVGVPKLGVDEMCCPSVEAAGTRRARVAGRWVVSSELLWFGRGANSFSSAMWGLVLYTYTCLRVLRTASRLSTGLSSR